MSMSPTAVPWWKRDLLAALKRRPEGPVQQADLKVPGSPLGRWNSLILANSTARREAKAVLFAELAEATRQGMPLDLALSHASQTAEEARRRGSRGWGPGADSRHRLFDFIVSLLMFLVAQLAYLLYMLLAFRMVDVERISRKLAKRLLGPVSAGLPLSQAMRRWRLDFDEAEVQLIEAGENWGTLPQALQRLSQFQVTEHRLALQGSLVLYPLWLAAILFMLMSFCIVFILPKFKDIYEQLGAELPGVTTSLIALASVAVTGPIGVVLTTFAVLLLVMGLVRGMMNGTRMSKIMLSLFMVAIPAFVVFISLADAEDFSIVPLLAGGVLCIVLLLLPYLLHSLEATVLRWERMVRPWIQKLPFIGRATRAEVEARWLGAYSLAIASGVQPSEALRSAGKISGGSIKVRSERAAELVDAGEEIGRACVRERVLSTQANHRLALLDGRPGYADGLRTTAEDAAMEAFETLHRTGRVVEVLSILALGFVAALFALAMYLPLFNIPNIVGHEADREEVRPHLRAQF